MTVYGARVRLKLGVRVRLNAEQDVLVVEDSAERRVTLEASPRAPIQGSAQLALIARPYATEAEALEGGRRWRRILEKAFARCNVGADFGDRTPTGAATEHYLAQLSAERGIPVVNDIHGVMAFQCDPRPLFIRSEAHAVVGKDATRLLGVLRTAAGQGLQMSDLEQRAYEIYSASFSTDAADARFMLLMMALETLMQPVHRPPDVLAYVEGLVASVDASGLSSEQVISIKGSLSYLKTESIGQSRPPTCIATWRPAIHGPHPTEVLHALLRVAEQAGSRSIP